MRLRARSRLLALTLAASLAGCSGPRPAIHGTLLEPPMAVPDFELASAGGRVAKRDLEGRLVVLVFGFTHCPAICPTTLARLARAMEELGPEAEEVRVVMITVDPERDTPQRMEEYATAFDPGFLGLTGSAEEIAEVAAAYGIFHARSADPEADGGYQVDHTTTITVLDRDGRARLLWAFGTEARDMASDLRHLIGG